MKHNVVKFFIAVGVCQATGVISSLFTFEAIPTWYAGLAKPFFAPPNWVFGPVWTLLYFLMGVSAYLIWKKGIKKYRVKLGLSIFCVQLFLNFIWSFLFFGLKNPLFALIDIVLLWGAIVATIVCFYSVSKKAAYLLIPYLLWVSFATVLNGAIVFLNK